MFGLEKTADAFDKMHADVQGSLDKALLVDLGQKAGETFGPDSILTTMTALPVGIIYSLSTFVMGAGKGLVDVLRLGEGVKEGTLSGVGSDVLRLLNIIPALGMVGKGLSMTGKMARVALASRVAGGAYQSSCGATASAAALRLSGVRIFITLDEIGAAIGKGSPKSANFPGMFFWEIKNFLMGVAPATEELNMAGSGVEAVETAAAQGKGPVVFGVQWSGAGNTRPPAIPQLGRVVRGTQLPNLPDPPSNIALDWSAGDHWLVAFKNLKGEIMVADQFGVRPISQIGAIGGTTSEFTLGAKALLVPEGAVVTGLNWWGTAGRAVTGAGASGWLTASFGVEAVLVDAKTTWSIDAKIRETLGRPPRDYSIGTDPSTGAGEVAPIVIPVPNPSSTLLQDSTLILSKLPRNGESREFSQIMAETYLPDVRVQNALFQVARSGLIMVLKWSTVLGKPTPIMVKRSLVQ